MTRDNLRKNEISYTTIRQHLYPQTEILATRLTLSVVWGQEGGSGMGTGQGCERGWHWGTGSRRWHVTLQGENLNTGYRQIAATRQSCRKI